MSIIVDWYNDNHTEIVHTYIGDWTWDELFAALDQIMQLMDSVNHTVNVIINMRQSQRMPTMFAPSSLRKIAYAAPTHHRNSGLFVILGANAFIKGMFSIFSKLYPHVAERYQFIEDEEQLESLLLDKQLMSG
jgi:hypothetical protein